MADFFNTLFTNWWGILIFVVFCLLVLFLLSAIFYKWFFKRIYDILFSLVLLIPFSLVFIVIAPIIYFTDKGPIFYNGERLGRKGKTFKMHKFRSMRVNAPDLRNSDGTTFNSETDPRVTKIGRFIRKTSIDELPQLLNVLSGNMSFVGPRPDLPDSIKLYNEETMQKLKVRPGITGYSQAKYRNTSTLEQRFGGDVYYVNHLSIWLDIKIIFMTLFSVLKRKNIYRNNGEQNENQ